MAFQSTELGGDALARRNEFVGFRIGYRADQKEGGKSRRCVLFSLVVRRCDGNQCPDQLFGTRYSTVVNAAALRIAEQKTAVSRDAVGIGNARAGDQQGCDRHCGGGHCFGSPSLLPPIEYRCCDLVYEQNVLNCLLLQRSATTMEHVPPE